MTFVHILAIDNEGRMLSKGLIVTSKDILISL